MAIEVIGKDESVKMKITCWNCASILLYTNADVTKEIRQDYLGNKDTYKVLYCPECKFPNYLVRT